MLGWGVIDASSEDQPAADMHHARERRRRISAAAMNGVQRQRGMRVMVIPRAPALRAKTRAGADHPTACG